jgi:hypothetical protein
MIVDRLLQGTEDQDPRLVNEIGRGRADQQLYLTCKMQTSKSGAEGIRTPDLRRAKAARYSAGDFWSLQNPCKSPCFCIDAFPSIAEDLLGLLHRCYGLHPHKVRDDRYSTSCLEATYTTFVLGEVSEVELLLYGVL